MKKYVFLSIFFVHLFLWESSYGRDGSIGWVSEGNNMENQSLPVEHAVIFTKKTHIVLTVQTFTSRFHLWGRDFSPDLFYKKFETSFFQSSLVRTSREDSKTRFDKLCFLQI
ncbi:MAG: hypothetical protein AB2L24_07210 [Mangrovibacterium sp.]